MPPTFQAIPLFRIFDVEKAKEFYVGWEARFDETAPLYMQSSCDGLLLREGTASLLQALHLRGPRNGPRTPPVGGQPARQPAPLQRAGRPRAALIARHTRSGVRG